MLLPLRYIFWTLLGFFLGGVLFSVHIPHLLKHIDIRTTGPDHNPGSANAFKTAGIPVGVLCLLCDLGKGFFPVFCAARMLDTKNLLFAFVLCAPVLGHAVAPYSKEPGGKAIAAAFGCLLGLLPGNRLVVLLIALYLFFSLVLIVRPHERRTVVVFGLFTLLGAVRTFFTRQWSVFLGAALLSAVVISRNLRDARLPDTLRRQPPKR